MKTSLACGDAGSDGADNTRRDRPATPNLAGPNDPSRGRRLAWGALLRRSRGIDCLACTRCGSRIELIAAAEDPSVAERILRHLGLPARPPPGGRPYGALSAS